MANILVKRIDSLRKPVCVVEANAALAKKPEVIAQIQKVKVRIAKIEEMVNSGDETSKNLSSLNKRTRTALIPSVLHCIAKVNGHKVAHSGAIPSATIKQTSSTLKIMKEEDFIKLLSELKGYVTINKASLAEMDYSNQDVESFTTLAQTYMDNCIRKQGCKKLETARNTMLKNEILQAKLAIKNLDIIMESYKQEYPETFTLYHLDRKVKNSQGQKVSVLGYFLDAETGQPAQSVSVKIYRLENDEQVKMLKSEQFAPESSVKPVQKKHTSAKGRINCRNMEAGSYVAVISKAGFVTKNVPLYVNPKETFKLKVNMEREA
jgi:5-hydroxyisourate hydrolase-like protein (transthyretin family)